MATIFEQKSPLWDTFIPHLWSEQISMNEALKILKHFPFQHKYSSKQFFPCQLSQKIMKR